MKKNPRRRQDAALGQGRPARILHLCAHEECPNHHKLSSDVYPMQGKGLWGLWECARCHERRLAREQWDGEYPPNKQE